MKTALKAVAVLVTTSVSGWSCSSSSFCDDVYTGSRHFAVKSSVVSREMCDTSVGICIDASKGAAPVIKAVSKEILEIAVCEILKYGAQRVGIPISDSSNLVAMGMFRSPR